MKGSPGSSFRVYVENPKKWENKLIGPVTGDGEWGEIRGSFTFHDGGRGSLASGLSAARPWGRPELRSLTIEPVPPKNRGSRGNISGETVSPDWNIQPAGKGRIRDGRLTLTAPGTAVLGELKTKDMQPL